MKPSAAKAKGRRFQQYVRDLFITRFGFSEDDVYSRTMGESGEDIYFGSEARKEIKYSIECKNVERLNFWDAYKQAESNCGENEPIVFARRNHQKALVLVDAEHFIDLLHNSLRGHTCKSPSTTTTTTDT